MENSILNFLFVFHEDIVYSVFLMLVCHPNRFNVLSKMNNKSLSAGVTGISINIFLSDIAA